MITVVGEEIYPWTPTGEEILVSEALVGVPPLTLTVNVGDTVRGTLTLESSYATAVTRDLLLAFGRYDAATGRFTIAFGNVRTGVSIPVGTSTQTVDVRATVPGTNYAGLAAVGRYDAATGAFTIEGFLVKTGMLTVLGVAVRDFTIAKV